MLAREGALSEGREEREKEKKIRGQGLQASGGRLSEVENDDMDLGSPLEEVPNKVPYCIEGVDEES